MAFDKEFTTYPFPKLAYNQLDNSQLVWHVWKETNLLITYLYLQLKNEKVIIDRIGM